MEDIQIVNMYWERNEEAIRETDAKYGKFCYRMARNILSLHEDAEECVNDTYLRTWNAIPTQRPEKLQAWLGRVVRNASLDLWNKNHTRKRYGGIELMLDELEECIPAGSSVERELEERELTELINRWLGALSQSDRALFVRRYWNGEKVKALAKENGVTQEKLTMRLYHLRRKLRVFLEREEYFI